MIINKMLKLKLLSDLCPASGDGFAGFVDNDVCFDNKGLPYIPGKRLKGCLRECGLDILSVNNDDSEIFDKLFGKTGELPGALHVGNGHLIDYDNIVKTIDGAYRSELMEVHTSIRSRTKMEGGKAASGTLRTIRVLNKGQEYEFPVTFTEETQKFFEDCVQSLRSMGLNRSRGLGEVKCELGEGKSNAASFNLSNEEKSFSYFINLLEPVISAERSGKQFDSEDYIFGSAILGAFAAKYIQRKGLPQKEAYADKDFRDIFLNGEVKFTAAMPVKEGEVYFPAPLTLKTNKLANRLSDESGGILNETDEDNPICKRLGGFVSVHHNIVKRFRPEKVTFIHHARPGDRGKGHADAKQGEMFTYEALSEEQMFYGRIIGCEKHLKLLSELFTDSDVLRIGRSRTAQYGKVSISPATVHTTSNAYTLKQNDEIRLVAVTPLILEDENGINTTNIEHVKPYIGSDFSIIRYTCAETTVAGYNGKWQLPRGQEKAIAEGSVIVLKYTGKGTELAENFIGRRTGEGFGQITIEAIPQSGGFSLYAEKPKPGTDCVPQNIMALRAAKNAVADGEKYGENFNYPMNNANLQRVITAVRASQKSIDEAQKQIDKFEVFAAKLCEIKQPEQKIAALVFATGKDKWYFKTDAAHLEKNHITGLLKQHGYLKRHGYEFDAYMKFLMAAGQRIKQKKRNTDKNRKKESDVHA